MLRRLLSARSSKLPAFAPSRRNIRFRASSSSAQASAEEDIQVARKWLADLQADTIPASICDVSFSRSSGPGGQNVNKVNSKATLKVPLSSLLPCLPALLHQPVRESRFHAKSSGALVIQSSDSRKQSDNTSSCYAKLYAIIREAGEKSLPGETSSGQRAHVKRLKTKENELRLKSKKAHASKKAARGGGGRGDY